jgi:hypothetical protein
MLIAAGILAVMLLIVVLVRSSFRLAKDDDEAFEELNERISQLYQVAASSSRTAGASARLALRRRVQPFREILRDVPGVGHRTQER